MGNDDVNPLAERAAKVFPGGTSNGEFGLPADKIVVMDRGEGCRLWDSDGREFLDFSMGWGSCLVGHAHPEIVDAVRERAALAQEELLSVVSEQMNERMYVLSLVAAVFLPLGFFTGLMGINVGGMPGVEDSEAFWVIVAICIAVMLALGVVFRWKKWL